MKSYLLRSVCGMAMAVTASGVAHAQDQSAADNFSSEDIVVTAQRREQRLQDVPIAVTALGEEAMRTKGINNIMDLAGGKVPGLQVASLFGSETAIVIAVRGQQAADASQGTADNPVSLYIDGVPYSRTQGAALDLVAPERIEVLRGPQGQLFGRNAEAGAVQIITRRPSGEWGGDFTGTLGSFSTHGLKGRLDLPSLAGIKIQLSGFFREHGAYLKTPRNPNLQNIVYFDMPAQSSFRFKRGNYDKNLSQLKTYGGRIGVSYDSGPFSVYYSYDQSWARDDQGLTHFLDSPDVGTIFNPTNAFNQPATQVVSAGPGGSFLFVPQLPLGSKYPDSINYSIPYVPFITKAHGHMLNLGYEVSDNLTLRSISGYRFVNRFGGNTLSQAVNAVLPSSTEYLRSRTYSEELQAIYDTDQFDVTVGAIYFREEIKDERASFFGVNCLPAAFAAAACIQNGQISGKGFAPFGTGFKRSFSTTSSYGLYGQGTWTPGVLDNRLQLIAGLRYSRETKKGLRSFDVGICPTGAQPLCATPGTPGVTALRNEYKTSRVDPAFTVKFDFTSDINVYARWARGFRSGGSSVRSPNFTSYDEDVLTSIEAGLKSQFWDRRITLNVAVFRNKLVDEQSTLQSDPSGSPSNTETYNIIKPRITKGFEVEASARLFGGFTLSGSYTHLKANMIDVGLDAASPGQPLSIFIPTGTADFINGWRPDAATLAAHPNSSIVRLSPQSSPKHSASISGDWRMSLGEVNMLLHGDWTYTSTQIVGAPNILTTLVVGGVATPQLGDATGAQARYNSGVNTNRFNARWSFQDIPLAGGASGEISLWVKNITDTADGAFAFGAGTTTPTPRTAIYLQPPRTYGVDFRVKF